MRRKKMLPLLLVLGLSLGLLGGCNDEELSGRTSTKNRLSEDEAQEELAALLTKVDQQDVDVEYDTESDSGVTGLAAELPEISAYDLVVEGSSAVNIEIFSSTEKATDNETDRWLIEVAEKFNAARQTVGSQTVSVSIRSIASGTATDYIVSGKYQPDAFSPANQLWGEMIKAQGGELELVSESLAGNTAGILITNEKYDSLKQSKSQVDINTIVNEALAGNILLGYTNPYVSSAGLNILTSMLQAFDADDPFGEAAVQKLEDLQRNIPPVSYTTAQMRETAKKGMLDAMVMEYQAYINTAELKSGYQFIPFGVRHDNPLYTVGTASDEVKAGLELFIKFARSSESQKLAAQYGFNALADYQEPETKMSGTELYKAQELWKEKKDAGQPVVAVFVADTSGSMEGTPITELKSSLLNASNYIGAGNHIGLVTYNHEVFVNLPISEFNNKQKAGFNGAVKKITAAGGTATYDAALVAADMLLQAKKDLPDAKLMMFVLSDGAQTEGYVYSKVEPVLQGLRIPIHSICYGEDLKEMEKMSALNEASVIKASPDDVVYNLKNIFNAQL